MKPLLDERAAADRIALLAGRQDIQRVVEFCPGSRGGPWLVGGALRDLLLDHEVTGFDFLTTDDVLTMVPALADSLGAAWSLTNRDFRLVTIVREGEELLTFSYLPEGESLEENLARRDFTANAMALDLRQLFEARQSRILDVRGGWEDLGEGVLRPCTWRGLIDHPVRVLRGIRFERHLGLELPSMAAAQVRSGTCRPLCDGDGPFWDELVRLLAEDAPEAEQRLVEFSVPEQVLSLPSVDGGTATPLAVLAAYRSLVSPLSWPRGEQTRRLEALRGDWGLPIRFLLMIGGEAAPAEKLPRELLEMGARESFTEPLGDLLMAGQRLRSLGYPWSSAHPDAGQASEATAAASLLLAARAMVACEEGDREVPAGPEPATLVRRALLEHILPGKGRKP